MKLYKSCNLYLFYVCKQQIKIVRQGAAGIYSDLYGEFLPHSNLVFSNISLFLLCITFTKLVLGGSNLTF